MALGLTHHGTPPKRFLNAGLPTNIVRLEREAIEVFGKKHNAATYRHWRNEGLTPTTDVRFDFEGAFNEAAANAANIHFNLDGFDLRQAWRLGQHADPYLCGPVAGGVRMPGFTNWEFVRVLGNPALCQKTAFWQNGRQVSIPRLLERIECRQMQPPKPSPQRESWLRCRRSLASRADQDSLFATAVQAIDWAVDHGIAERTHARLCLDRLVISDAEPRAEGGSMLVLVPKPASVELRLYRGTGLAERVEIDHRHLFEQLDRLISQFRGASNL